MLRCVLPRSPASSRKRCIRRAWLLQRARRQASPHAARKRPPGAAFDHLIKRGRGLDELI